MSARGWGGGGGGGVEEGRGGGGEGWGTGVVVVADDKTNNTLQAQKTKLVFFISAC